MSVDALLAVTKHAEVVSVEAVWAMAVLPVFESYEGTPRISRVGNPTADVDGWFSLRKSPGRGRYFNWAPSSMATQDIELFEAKRANHHIETLIAPNMQK